MKPIKIVCQNKKARHDYHIEETFEAGMVLKGSEVKSLRMGRANLKDAYARLKGNELYLLNAHISPYPHARENHLPERDRKLLLHKRELRRLIGKIKERGYSLIPLKIYFNKKGLAKVELALAKGKKKIDKREDLKRKIQQRELKGFNRY